MDRKTDNTVIQILCSAQLCMLKNDRNSVNQKLNAHEYVRRCTVLFATTDDLLKSTLLVYHRLHGSAALL